MPNPDRAKKTVKHGKAVGEKDAAKASRSRAGTHQENGHSLKRQHAILAIDQGTTGTTVHIINERGRSLAKVNQEFRQFYPKPAWVEHRPEDIWRSVLSCIEAGLKKARLRGTDIAAIGITNQRESVVIWDRKTHRAVHNALVWQDRRTSDLCERWKNEGHETFIKERTGLVIDPYFSASKIKWLLDHVAGLRAKGGGIAAGTIDSYLIWRLTAGASHVTDVSNGSRTQLMNLDTVAWDNSLLDFFEVPRSILPNIESSSGWFGTTKGLNVLPDGIPITGVAGDQQAALFGQACFSEGDAKCTFGTGSFLLMNTGSKRVPSPSGLLTTIAWRLKSEESPTYALEGGAFICGAAVQFLRDQMRFIKKSSEIEALAKSVKETEGVEFVPALTGLGAPYWDPYARGLLCGLTRGTRPAHVARATLEAMALQNSDILEAMQSDANGTLRSLRVDGGASENNLLMQMQADYLGVEVVRPRLIETTSAGAAYLAGLGAGLFSGLEDIKRIWKTDRSFTPKLSSAERENRLRRWHLAVGRARSTDQERG